MQERKTALLYVNSGPRRQWAGMGTNSTVYNKTLFEKIYVTLKYKNEGFTCTYISFCSPAPTQIWSGHI